MPSNSRIALPLAITLTLLLGAPPALADSTSSASSASSTSVGSSSASLGKSSDSSSAKDKVAQGQYTVVEITEVADRQDMLRVRLLAAADQRQTINPAAAEFELVLSRQASELGQLRKGQTITVLHRPYGLALAASTGAGDTKPFFLVLEDNWYRELESRPVAI